jgi:di/tripeptidase
LSQKLTNSGANVTSNVGDGNLYAIKGTPKVCFQAHMDMVGSKVNGSNFDFENDPIECVTDGD